jgi:hypothetical protein
MALRHSRGVSVIDIEQKRPDLILNQDYYGISDFLITSDKRHIVYCNDYKQIVKDLIEDLACRVKITVDDMNIVKKKIVNNGDFLFQSKIYLEEEENSKNSSKLFINVINFWDIDVIIKSQSVKNKRQKKYSEDIERRSQIKRLSLLDFKQIRGHKHPGKFVLLELTEEISCFSLICDKGLEMPFVFENDQIVTDLSLDRGDINTDNWQGHLRVGTVSGNCFLVKFSVDSRGVLSRNVEEVFVKGNPKVPILKSLDKDEKYSMGSQFVSSEVVTLHETPSDDCLYVHDYKHFLKESLEIALLSSVETKEHEDNKLFKIFYRVEEEKGWYTQEVKLPNLYSLSSSANFKLFRMNNLSKNQKVRFYFMNYLGIGVFSICKSTHQFKFETFFEKNISESTHLVYSFSFDFFVFVVNNSLEIWNSCLKILIHKLEFPTEIIGIYLVENEKIKRLLVYEQKTYSELNLYNLRVVRQQEMQKNKNKGLVVPVHLDILPNNKSLRLPFFRGGVSSVRFVSDAESFNLFSFPFYQIPECFSKNNYKKNILLFAEYYFETIRKFDFIDGLFGPLNPFILAIFHNDITLVEHLLEKFRYPQQVLGYFSPLSFAFEYGYKSAVQVFCDQLYYRQYFINFSDLDFFHLLNSEQLACQNLLKTIPREMQSNQFPNYLSVKKNKSLYFSDSLIELLIQLKKKEYQKQLILKKISDPKKKKKKMKKLGIKKKEIMAMQIPFKYSFKAGTYDSISFLEKMTFSKSKEFVMSNSWKSIVESKWKSIYPLLVLKAILFGLHLAFIFIRAFIHQASQETKANIKMGFLVCWIFFFSYMILEITSFVFFSFRG